MLKNVMLDIETLSTKPNAVILSIAAVKFAFGSDGIEKFSVNISPSSCKKLGLITSQYTIDWWTKQNPEALKQFMKDQIDLSDAIDKLNTFIGPNSKDTVFWAHGTSFDFPKLEWSYDVVNKPYPWKYWNIRDTRTVYEIFGIDMRKYERVGTYHNAIDDCLTQIKALKEALS